MNTLDLLLETPLFCLFITVALGLIIGRITFKGISLGAAGVLFVALTLGHFGYSIPDGIGTLGLVIFIYCIGIAAGGRFLSALSKEGCRPLIVALVTMGSSALVILLAQHLLNLPKGIALGLYTGAMSSAPALAAASEGLANQQDLIVGYGIAYPMGIIGIILFVQIIPKIAFKSKLDQEIIENQTQEEVLQNVLVEINSPAVIGRNISEFGLKHLHGCQIARRLKGERLLPLAYEDTFEKGQCVLIVGREEDIEVAIELLGSKSHRHYVRDIEHERKQLQVYNKQFVGKSINDISPLRTYGVMITRISRYGFTFVPKRDTIIESRDILRVIGQPSAINHFAKSIGHKQAKEDGIALLSISIGIALGVFLGMIPFSLPGSEAITLGLAGGPLIVALILGHFGHIGPVVTHIPRDTRELLQNIGLVFFVADAGIRGGESFVTTFQQFGISLFLVGLAITAVAIISTFITTAYMMRMSPLSALGALCGSLTATPALGSLTARYQSQIPVINYATIYPVALIIITLTAKLLVAIL